jgi:hypothetical protein
MDRHTPSAQSAKYGLERRLYEGTVSRLLYPELLYIEVAASNTH